MQFALVYAINALPLAAIDHDSGPWDSEWWWVWRLSMFLIFFAVIIFVFWWSRRCWGPRHHELSGVERARGILAERYARGEIEGEEYRERLSQLE